MTAAQAIEVQADYAIKGRDLRTYYAGFTRRALPDGAIWRLSLASSCLPQGHPGYMAWLTTVAGAERFCPELQQWAIGLGATIARMKPRLRTRARTFVASYDHAWGRQASLDGLCIALGLAPWLDEDDESDEMSLRRRAKKFGCDREAYGRIRAFVAGAILLAVWQYEDALVWAHRVARDS